MSTVPAMPDNFCLYDTTLRDGTQQEGMQLSNPDKLRIAGLLDDLGVGFIEGGWPGSNPADTEFFAMAPRQLELRNAKLVAFGATRKAGSSAAQDRLLQALLEAETEWICLVAKSHDLHVTQALRTTLDENLAMITDSVRHLVERGRKVIVDCEHFFDGYRHNPVYALEAVRTAAEAGAEYVVLCDTNGGMLPSDMGDIVSAAGQVGIELGIHCHNDSGCAVANTLAAIEAGATMAQGTMNGYGERTGNADLTTVIGNVALKWGWPVLSPHQLHTLTSTSHTIAEIASQPGQPRQPYVGDSAFAHKAGLHASAIKVNESLYQHIEPEAVGNDMRMLISDMAGRANIQIKGEQLGLDLADRDLANRLSTLVKERESAGYSYEAADASFELLAREAIGALDRPFELISWRVFSEGHAKPEMDVSEATVKLEAKGQRQNYVGEGNGPVNALGDALNRALVPAYPFVANYDLVDYRVRILDKGHGTDATVRVLIDTTDGKHRWTTVGVGTNVIEASWEALAEAYLYGLIHNHGAQTNQ